MDRKETESGPGRDKDFVTHGTALRLSFLSVALPVAPKSHGGHVEGSQMDVVHVVGLCYSREM